MEKSVHKLSDFDYSSKRVRARSPEETLLFADFSNAFDYICKRKINQIFLAYHTPKETVSTIIMLYKDIKADEDNESVRIVIELLQGID